MNIKEVWRRLVHEEKSMASADEVRKLCSQAGLDYKNVVDYLQQAGYIDTVMREIFYIKTPREVELGYIDRPLNEIIGMAMEKRGISNWYFGLETALKYNHMTHQYFDITFIISDSYRTTKTVVMLGKRIKYHKWKSDLFTFGIKEKGVIRYSDAEKTLLDLAYRATYNGSDPVFTWYNYLEDYTKYDRKRMRTYLNKYPKSLQKVLKWEI